MANRYWVGGTASWNGTAGSKWSLTSGGAGGQAEPTSSDDVFFNASSGTGTITVDTNNATCKSLTFTGFTGTFTGSTNSILVYGNMTLVSGMTYTFTNDVIFNATGTLISAGKTIGRDLQAITAGTVLTLGDNTVATRDIIVNNATAQITCVSSNVTCGRMITNTSGAKFNMGSGTWECKGVSASDYAVLWSGTNSINAQTSTLKITNTASMSNINFYDFSGGQTYNNVWIAQGTGTGTVIIWDSNTFNDFKDDGTGTHTIQFTAGKTQTFTTFNVNGTSGHLITITSTSTATHTLTKSSGTVSCDYLDISHSVAQGGANWYAGTHSTNNQATATAGSGWVFTGPPASGPANLKSYNTNLKANIKSIDTNLIANVKSLDTNV